MTGLRSIPLGTAALVVLPQAARAEEAGRRQIVVGGNSLHVSDATALKASRPVNITEQMPRSMPRIEGARPETA